MRRWAGAIGLVLAVALGPAIAAEPAPEGSIRFAGKLDHPGVITLGQLRAMPQSTALVAPRDESKTPIAYRGVLLWTVLAKLGIKTDPGIPADLLHRTITLTALDDYQIVLSVGEIDPEFGGEPALLALEKDGAPIDDHGQGAVLVLPGDKAHDRFISALTRIEIK